MKIRFQVTGMTCAACSARVEKVSAAVSGVKKAEVNLLKGTMSVEAEDDSVVDKVINAVQKAGYDASVFGSAKEQEVASSPIKEMKARILWSFAFLLVLMYFTMGHMFGLPLPAWYHGEENSVVAALLQFILTIPVVFLNRIYFVRGFGALYHRSPNMDSLIAVGSSASLIYGLIALFRMSWAMGHGHWETVMRYSENLYFESAAMILTLITLGKFLETRAKGKTGDAIKALMDLSPKTAIVVRNNIETEIPVEQVQPGDILAVRSGMLIPVDGVILEGRGAVDQSALTGESIPVEKNPGDSVSAATVNREGYFRFRAEKVGEDTTFSQVIRLVEEAGGSKAPIARLADKIAGVFVPVVMGISLVTFLVWILAGESLEFALSTAISVLVISCPCALGLATPVAIMVGIGRGATMGVLFKNAETLETLHKIDTVVLDKTGTVTLGKPAVTDLISISVDSRELLRIAAALESKSEHPFAKAILDKASDMVIPVADDFETLPGRGVRAVVGGVCYLGGNERLMQESGIEIPLMDHLKNKGVTPLYFAEADGKCLGVIGAADVVKKDSPAAISAMRALGLDVIMLTGDNRLTAESIASQSGIDHVISDVLPEDKAGIIEELRQQGHKVLMVGDGINDAPALVMADVGMAIGSGTDIAIESADVVLMNSSLQGVASAVELSKATIRNIKQNLFWAFFYNSLGIPVAAGVLYPMFGILLSPMIAAAAMSMSSVFVVTNALRLRLFHVNHAEDTVEIQEKKEVRPMTTVIKVGGMMCPHCQARVESVCKGVDGVTDAVVDLAAKTVTVSGNAARAALEKVIVDAGYEILEG